MYLPINDPAYSSERNLSQSDMDSTFFNPASATLCQMAENRSKEMQTYSNARPSGECNGNRDLAHLIYDAYVQTVELHGIQKMPNFSFAKIGILCYYLQAVVGPVWHRGRIYRCKNTTCDVLFSHGASSVQKRRFVGFPVNNVKNRVSYLSVAGRSRRRNCCERCL